MGKKKKARRRVDTSSQTGGLGGLGSLLRDVGLEASASPVAPAAEATPADEATVPVPRKLALQRSRKGRGGRTVTLVRGLAPADLEVWAKRARKALGCGASVEGDAVVLQGDIGDRAAAWLTALGVARISR